MVETAAHPELPKVETTVDPEPPIAETTAEPLMVETAVEPPMVEMALEPPMVETAAGATACVPSLPPGLLPPLELKCTPAAPECSPLEVTHKPLQKPKRRSGSTPRDSSTSRDSAESASCDERSPTAGDGRATTGDAPPPSLLDVLPAPGKVVLTEEMLAPACDKENRPLYRQKPKPKRPPRMPTDGAIEAL